MNSLYSSHARAERLIVMGRAVLAGASLLAVWLDPSTPIKYAETTYALLVIYLVYALLLIPLVWRSTLLLKHLGSTTHVIDLLAFSCLLYFTEGPASPFFVYFVFFVLCATLRWQWRGVLWSTLAALGIFIALGLYAAYVLNDPDFELNRFLIRNVYLVVVAIMLGYLSLYEQRLRGELARLAAWPRDIPGESLLRELLQTAAAVLDAPRVVMVWEEPEEPWRSVATCSHGDFHCTREPPTAFEPLVAGSLAASDFFCSDTRAPAPVVPHLTPTGLQRWHGAPLHPDLQVRFDISSVLALYLQGENIQGYLLALDKQAMTSDDLVLGKIVSHRLAADLDQFYLRQRLQQAAVTEERIRLARDLHDGVLQSLTGAALQLQAVHRLLDADLTEARDRLLRVQALIAAEQRDLRSFVQQLKPAPTNQLNVDSDLVTRLEELCRRIEQHWGLRVKLAVETPIRRLGNALAQEVYRIVQEALINAARHAQASTVKVELGLRGDNRLGITVIDDGRGFPCHGRYDLAALNDLQQGPVSLRGRVTALKGELIVESSGAGARLKITLPLRIAHSGTDYANHVSFSG